MRLNSAAVALALSSCFIGVLAREPVNAEKLSFDHDEMKRERRRSLNQKKLERRGIFLSDSYEEHRKLVDVTKDLHAHDSRILQRQVQDEMNKQELMKTLNKEDLSFWDRFLPETSLAPTPPPPTAAPPTEAPPTVAPPTIAPPTAAPPTNAPPTVAPPTNAPPTTVAPPPTNAQPTILFTPVPVAGTPVPAAPIPPAQLPPPTPGATPAPIQFATPRPAAPSVIPPTFIGQPTIPPPPSVVAPPTVAPPTVVPPTLAPPTVALPTVAPPTVAPPTVAPPTVAPPSVAPPTVAPPTVAPPTVAPPTVAPPTNTPPTVALPTNPPPTNPPPTNPPPTNPPPTNPPPTNPPPTNPPPTNAAGVRARQVIEPVAIFGGTEFQDPNSYQSRALAWLEGSQLDGFSDDKLIQRYALACIYYATYNVSTTFTDEQIGAGNIFGWNRERDWLSNTDECTWANVLCDGMTTGFIERMDFFGNFLTGEFPGEITYLKGSLKNLDLSDNPVFTLDTTFNSWLGTLTNLERLRYEDTNFISTSGIPTEIGNMKNLGFYECSNCRYSGPINGAAFPSDMTQLSYIEMEFNTFNSPIPASVGQLPNLEFFYARGSDITGNLDFMMGMPKIQEVWVDRNPAMTGNLPDFLGSLSTLGSFSVTRSGWSGPLPASLGNLATSLRQMYFFENAFTGMVPDSWGALTNLEELEMQNNMLTGQIPQSVCRNSITRGLDLDADCAICPANCCDTCF